MAATIETANARKAIGRYLEAIYKRQRLHSALGDRPPEVFKENLPALHTTSRQRRHMRTKGLTPAPG